MPDLDLHDRLGAIRRVATAITDELAESVGDRRYDELLELGAELRAEVGGTVRTVRGTGDRLPAADTCRQMASTTTEVLELAADDDFALGCLDIEGDLIDLIGVVARFDVAERLRDISIGEVARATGLAKGYVSELRRAKKGLPSDNAASKLDEYLNDEAQEIRSIVEGAKTRVAELRAFQRRRGNAIAPGGVAIPSGLRDRDRVEAAAESLRRDDAMLQLVERLAALSARERRAVDRLVAELTTI